MFRTVFCTLLMILLISGCTQEEPTKEESQKEGVAYEDFYEGDFYVKKPVGWDELQGNESQRVLGLSKGICSMIVDKHNAKPKEVHDWLSKAITEKIEQNLITSFFENDTYYIYYEFPYQQYTVTASTKVFYCNYLSYVTQLVCLNEIITPEFEEIRDFVLNSSRCTQEYEVPSPVKIEEKKVDIEAEEPEVIEEIEEEIVQTNIGEEFGINEGMVVYFINNNEFFRKIMEDFPRSNILVEDDENNRELKLKVNVDNEGYITLVEDGEHDNADVTLIIPLTDALNIFGNAQNINPVTLIGFAINVRTDPPEIKNQVIQKVLSGEYN
jgi:hypothetical protein